MQTHRETLTESRDAAVSLLRQGHCSATEIARRTGLSRVTIERLKRQLGVRTNRDARAAAQARTVEERLAEATEQAQALQARLDRERELHARTADRAERKDQQLRDARKKDKGMLLYGALGFSVYDLLPTSAWHVLLEGGAIPVSLRHPRIERVEQQTELVLTDLAREALREVVAVREEMEIDDDTTSMDEQRTRDRFLRLLRIALYGGEGDAADERREQRPTLPRKSTPGSRSRH